jgi:hypothetical protein
MWLPDSPSLGPTSELTLFAAQAWRELLSPQSPDTFQARVLDLPMLIEELAEVASLSVDDERWASYLQTIVDEIADAAEVEGPYLTREPRLKAALESFITNTVNETKTPNVIAERARIASTQFGDVLQRWKAHAQELASGDGREKGLFLHRLSTIATSVLNRGLEDESLAVVTPESCYAGPASFVDSITNCLSSNHASFDCVIALQGKHGDLAALISGSNFSQVGRGNGIRQDDVSRKWHSADPNRFFVGRSCFAFSRRMAAEQCLLDISTLLNVQNLYHNSAEFRAAAEVLVYDRERNPFIIEVNPEKHFGLFPRGQYRKLARDTCEIVGDRLQGRLSNALECHALALNADNPKTALINLWTALETITGSMGVKVTGQRVAHRIAPLVAYRRVDKIATYLALSVHAATQLSAVAIDKNRLPESHEGFIAPDDILRAVTRERANPSVMYLFSICANSPLLLNRLYTVWEQFSDPKSLARSLAKSRRRVEWQISRIYRARNLLVHKGEQSRHTWRLLRNAHYYVSTVLSRVLHDLREQRDWTVDTALVHQSQRYDYIHDRLLKEKGRGLVYSDLLLQKTRSADRFVFGEE